MLHAYMHVFHTKSVLVVLCNTSVCLFIMMMMLQQHYESKHFSHDAITWSVRLASSDLASDGCNISTVT